jgi:Ca-activated chloride channel family protein
MKAVFPTVAFTLALGSLVLGQEQQKLFRSSVVSVPIYATVMDANGRLVPDLTQADFEVVDNLKPSEITNFVAEVQPVAVVVALDLSGSMVNDIALAKDGAEAFMIRLLPQDRARVVGFDDVVRFGPDFTNDRDRLIRYIQQDMQYGNGTRLWDAMYESIGALRQEPSRKVIVVLSDGDDTTSRMSGKDDVLTAALANDVMVYTVGLRTHYRGGYNGSMIEGRPDKSLKQVSEHTGGGFFELSRSTELNATFSKVADEIHRQYLIAITAQSDGKPHTLGVKVKRPGMTVRARRTYVASPPAK